MGTYQPKDRYYRKAKEQGLPSRASFKIEEILSKFKLIGPGETAIDLGAAPGGWTVQLAKAVGHKGQVLALDLQAMPKVGGPNIRFFQGDFRGGEADDWIRMQLGGRKAKGVFSDLSPKLSGIGFRDAYLSFELARGALELAKRYLKKGGHFVTKVFPGEEFPQLIKAFRENFDKVRTFEPKSSRKTSKEVYLLGMGFHSNDPSA